MPTNVSFRLWTAVSCGLILTGALCNPMLATASASKDFSIVSTENGSIEGSIEGDYRRFLGIPFAAPPVGNLRFAAPQPVKSWHGVRKATHFGHACPQGTTWTDEDCLYLNVYTPYPVSKKPVPVMVWIYGGAYILGSGATYPPTKIVPKNNVILVAINYRVGAFGFLAHPALTAESEEASGNYGLLDQQAAIAWVKRNARAFGGDPNNITIFGESAGGASVCANLASPAMAGQFQRAIMESGPCFLTKSLPDAEAYGQSIASQNGCPTTADAAAAECLRKLPVSAFAVPVLGVLGGTGSGSITDSNAIPYAPTYGGPVLPLNPPTALATGQFNHVPMIVGSNHDEMRLFTAISDVVNKTSISSDQYPSLIQATYTSNAAAVLSQYPLTNYASPDIAFSAPGTDSIFSCPALSNDQQLVQNGNITFAYEFADENAPSIVPFIQNLISFPLGAAHSTEIPYLFPLAHLDPAQKRLSDLMVGYWTHFAKTGDPNFFGAPKWPQFDASQNNLLSLVPDATQVTTGFAADHQCAFWAGLPPQQ